MPSFPVAMFSCRSVTRWESFTLMTHLLTCFLLELCDPGFDHSVLSEFRSRLVEGHAEQRLLDLLLERCREGGWLKAHGRQRTDSTHVLARIRSLSRLLRVAQTIVYVLNVRIARWHLSGF